MLSSVEGKYLSPQGLRLRENYLVLRQEEGFAVAPETEREGT